MAALLLKNDLIRWVEKWKMDPIQTWYTKALMYIDSIFLESMELDLSTNELKRVYKKGYQEKKQHIEQQYWEEIKRRYPMDVLKMLGVQVPID